VNRRELVAGLGGTAAWPIAARGQQHERMRRIGALMNMAADDPEGQASIAAFHQGLQEWGWTLGRNARIEVRWGSVDADSSRRYAVEVVALACPTSSWRLAAKPWRRCTKQPAPYQSCS
jgi:putative ABC transport system substrate-binding protein